MSFLDGLEPKRRDHLLQLAASRLQPQVAAAPPPAGQLSAADAAGLRVRAHTLAEENASLRRNLQAMVAQAKRSEAELQVGAGRGVAACYTVAGKHSENRRRRSSLVEPCATAPSMFCTTLQALPMPFVPHFRHCGARRQPSSSVQSSNTPPRLLFWRSRRRGSSAPCWMWHALHSLWQLKARSYTAA